MTEDSIPIGQLRWRCRRGTKELDRILGGFLEHEYLQSDPALQRAFVSLLEVQDPDIYDWLMGVKQPADEKFKNIVCFLQKIYGISGR
jgi:antitoxin CptB